MNKINIPEENLHCHHILFIKDVVESSYVKERNCFKTLCTRLSYRKARLNGIIVVVQNPILSNEDHYIWLDDGTSIIRVILSPIIRMRKDAVLIKKGASISVFGPVVCLEDDEIILECSGFAVDEDDTGVSELYHWLKAMADRPQNVPSSQIRNMFYSISSQQSPNRLLSEGFLASPLRDFNQENTGYLWSPDHAFATSTPLRAVINEDDAVPVDRLAVLDEDDDEEFDSFDDFGDLDVAAFETDALQQEPHLQQQQQVLMKRKFSLSMDE